MTKARCFIRLLRAFVILSAVAAAVYGSVMLYTALGGGL